MQDAHTGRPDRLCASRPVGPARAALGWATALGSEPARAHTRRAPALFRLGYRSETTTQHDMAPLLKVEAGSGPCGAWPDLLLIGWADGSFTSLHPSNGSLHWKTNWQQADASLRERLDGWSQSSTRRLHEQ